MSEPLDLMQLSVRATAAAQAWRPGVEITGVRTLTGGSSSLTYLADAKTSDEITSVVLKVAPPGLPPVRNRDVLRQGRLMRALHGQPGVLVPEAYFEAGGVSLEAPPFVAMSFVPGVCAEPELEEQAGQAPAGEVNSRALDGARMLADLHRLDPASIGLGDEPVMTLSDEIDRWTRAFGTVSEDLQGEYLAADRALRAVMPPMLAPTVIHGDYRLGNTLCVEGKLTAIIDWEIWAIGDGRIDVGWFKYFAADGRHPATVSDEPTGMPTGSELQTAYERARGSELPDMDWFTALTWYKEAAATALLIKRARKAGAVSPGLSRIELSLTSMITDAIDLVS